MPNRTTRFDDDCISIDLPDGWNPEPIDRGYYIRLANRAEVTLIIGEEDPDYPLNKKVANFARVFSQDANIDPPPFKATVIDPFLCGMHTGARVDRDFGHLNGSYAGLIVNDTYVYVQTLGLSEVENDMAWKAIGSLQLKAGVHEIMQARTAALLETGPEEEPRRLIATDLSKVRTMRFTTWMDHFMALLMDSKSYPEDGPDFDDESQTRLLVPYSERSMWLLSRTEFDVKLEFIVRAVSLGAENRPPRGASKTGHS